MSAEPQEKGITETIVDRIRERAAVGFAKYGQTMDRDDLTPEQWIQHASEELMDGLQYLEALRRKLRQKSV